MRADGQQLVNQAMGGILRDSINEMGAKRCLKVAAIALQGVVGGLGGLQTISRTNGKPGRKIFRQFGKDVCSRGQ